MLLIKRKVTFQQLEAFIIASFKGPILKKILREISYALAIRRLLYPTFIYVFF